MVSLALTILFITLCALPGFICAYLICNDAVRALAVAPAVSCGIVCLSGVLVDALPLASSAIPVLAIAFITSMLMGAAVHILCNGFMLRRELVPTNPGRMAGLGLIVVFCLAFFAFMLLGVIDPNDSFVQYSDNLHHLSNIKSFMTSGVFNAFKTASYPQTLLQNQVPEASGVAAFYPSAFTIFAALGASLSDASAVLAENAMLYWCLAFCYPLGMFSLLESIFPRDNNYVLVALALLIVPSFPLYLIIGTPLYPNLLGMLLMPAAASLFILLIGENACPRERVSYGVLFALSCVSLFFSHPNSFFAMAVLLLPYCCHRIFELSFKNKKRPFAWRIGCSAAFVVFAACIWLGCYHSSFFEGVVSYYWQPLLSFGEAIKSVLDFSLRRGIACPIYSALVVIGIVSALRSRQTRWLVVSFFLMAAIYVVNISMDGEFKQLFSGFWYNDPWRTSAALGLFSIPLGYLGLVSIRDATAALFKRVSSPAKQLPPIAPCFFIALLIALVPSFGFNGALSQMYDTKGISAMLYNRQEIQRLNGKGSTSPLTSEEENFLDSVKDIVGSDLVLNNPYDGSAYAYVTDDINVYYKERPGSKETSDAKLVKKIDEYDTNADVEAAVQNTGAKYVLLLSTDNYTENYALDTSKYLWCWAFDYPYTDWSDFNIDSDDSSFVLVASSDNCRLYEIEDAA
ncbi:DUF6541 family protein [Paratractidigestivibacter sp.]|uniref:DUF6541 family protein n=1 Tax=Paratractidigestivibacter sp. TaxID=2847316 RepID=UPI002ABD6891|nr:DUF6541 family protein [Paratractidigestivibacter sp.]